MLEGTGLPRERERENTQNTKLESAKISPSGILPGNIVADSEDEAIDLFNKANYDEGFGWLLKKGSYAYNKGYTIVPLVQGKEMKGGARKKFYGRLYQRKDGTWYFL